MRWKSFLAVSKTIHECTVYMTGWAGWFRLEERYLCKKRTGQTCRSQHPAGEVTLAAYASTSVLRTTEGFLLVTACQKRTGSAEKCGATHCTQVPITLAG